MGNDRMQYNLYAIISAFVLLGLVCLYAISKSTSSDIATMVGALATAAGTITGAYIGAYVGAEGKQAAIEERKTAQQELGKEMNLRYEREQIAQTLLTTADETKIEELPPVLQNNIKTFSEDIGL